MGVDLGSIVNKKEITLEHLSGKKVAIDAYNALYQFLATIRQPDGTLLMDSRGRITSHLSGIFYRSIRLMEKGIRPVYVFDGKPPELKRETIQKRIEVKEEAEKKWMEALKEGDLAGARKHAQATSRLTKEMVGETKELLNFMGLPFVQAPGEGEAQAAHMNMKGDVWACASQDYDSIIFGAEKLVRNLALTGKRKLPGRNEYVNVEPELIELTESLQMLELDRRKLIWVGILVGTDFNPGIRGIGPKKALLLVKKFDSFEKIISELKAPEWFMEVERIFLEPKTVDDYGIKFNKPQVEGIVEFLCNEREFSEERIRNALAKIKDSGVQTTLEGFL